MYELSLVLFLKAASGLECFLLIIKEIVAIFHLFLKDVSHLSIFLPVLGQRLMSLTESKLTCKICTSVLDYSPGDRVEASQLFLSLGYS